MDREGLIIDLWEATGPESVGSLVLREDLDAVPAERLEPILMGLVLDWAISGRSRLFSTVQ